MANEFVARNGIIAKANSTISGTLDVSGNITMGSAIVATQTWVTGTALTGYATQSYVTTAINNLIDAAPGTLNTLNELAAALGDDPNFATTITNSIATKLPLAGGALTGDLQLGENQLLFDQNNVAAPSTTNQHTGTRILLYPAGSGAHYAIGIESSNMWFNSDGGYKWYNDSNNIASLSLSGVLYVNGGNSGQWNTAYSWGNHAGLYASASHDHSGVYAPISHTHSAADITSGTLASARLSGTYAINVSGSAATLTTARTISLTGDVTGSTTFNGSANVSITATVANDSHTHAAENITGGVLGNSGKIGLASHPEGGGLFIPSFDNDLAHIVSRGGTVTFYKTTDATYTDLVLTNSGSVGFNTTIPFNGTPNYASASLSSTSDVVICDIEMPFSLSYGNTWYVDFGNGSWMAKDLSFYAYQSDNNAETVYKIVGSPIVANTQHLKFTSGSYSHALASGGTGYGYNRLRVVMTNWQGTNPRIAAIGARYYNSTSLSQTLLSTGGGTLYGNLVFNNATDDVKLSKGATFLNLKDPYNNVHLSNAGNGVYIDSTTHYWRPSNGLSYWMTLNSAGLGIGTTSPAQKLHIGGGHILIENNYDLRAKDTAGSERTIVRINSSNEVEYGWSGSGPVKFMGGGSYTERMRIHTNGNVGIGTTNPVRTLSVNGSFLATTNSINLEYNSGIIYHGGSYYQFPSGSYYLLYGRTGMGLIFGSNNAEVGRFDLSGNLGIGTTSPTQKLDVNGNIALSGNGTGNRWILLNETNTYAGTLRLQAGGGSAGYGGGINMYGHSHATNPGDVAVGISANSGGSFRVNTSGIDTGTDLLVVKSTGNVGIGTSSPESASQLHIYKGTAAAKITLETTDSYESLLNFSAATNEYSVGFNKSDNTFRIANANSLSSNVRMVINNAGNVGIGTTSPSYALDVQGLVQIGQDGTYGGGYGMIGFGGTTNGEPRIFGGLSNKTLYITSGTGGNIHFRTNGTSTNAVIIDSSGNVGIGTTAPASPLHINTGTGTSNANTVIIDRAGTNDYSGVSFATAGTVDWSIGHNNAGNFEVFEDGQDAKTRLTIATGGNVGIGITNPNEKLQIAGNIRLPNFGKLYLWNDNNSNYLDYNNWITVTGATQTIQNSGNGGITFKTLTDTRMFISSSGNIGIGSTSPTTKLYIQETAASPTLLTLHNYQPDITPGSGNFIEFLMTDDNVTATPQVKIGMVVASEDGQDSGIATEGDGNFVIMTMDAIDSSGTGTLAERVRVTHTGKVGIGTSSPTEKLHVAGNIRTTGSIYLANTNIVGVNQLEIDDPGEGIIWRNGASGDITLAVKDDATDNILELTGTNASLSVNGFKVATESYVTTAISNLVDSAPGTLDTLNELAAALGDDPNFSTTITTALGNRLRVDTAAQGLNATQQSNGRTNLGLGTAATSSTSDFAAASHTHNIWDLPFRRSSVNVDNVGNDNLFETIRTTGTGQGTWPGSYEYLVSFGDESAGIQFVKSFGTGTKLYFRGGTDNPNSENGANTYTNWRGLWDSSDFSSTNISNWNTAYGWGNHAGLYAAASHTHSYLPLAGGTLTGDITGTKATFISDFTAGTNALNILGANNGLGTGITFSDNGTPAASNSGQNGYITYYHGDGQSYGSGNVFVLSSSETTMTILADGKLMYKEGIYSKPTSGTGAGIRKDTNWDTAYGWGDHGSAGYAPIASPTFTGSPRSVTPISSSNDTSIATTAFVKAQGYSTTTGTVTSVGLTVPTGLAVSGTPVTTSGTLAVTFASGYSIPTNTAQTNWNTAYGWGNHAGLYLPIGAKAADSELLDGQDSTGFFRLISGVAGTSLDTVTANGFTTASYTGYSSQIWNINTGGSTGTVQMEFEYNTPVRGFKIRNRTDNNNWSATGWVVMSQTNQGHIGGTIWHSGNDGASSGLDADLLDGQQGSYYLDSTNLTGTIPSARLSGTYSISVTGNANTATTLATSRTIALSGDVTGSASFNGGSNITITATVADDSHNHIISNVDGLQTALDSKATLAGPNNPQELAFFQSPTDITSQPELMWTGADLMIVGGLQATTKSFNIEHPTKPGKRLVYGVLEGPEHGVYTRGRTTEKTISLPEEWTGLVDEDSITVQLTAVGKPCLLYVVDIADNKVFVDADMENIEYFYYIQGTRKDIDKLEIEQ